MLRKNSERIPPRALAAVDVGSNSVLMLMTSRREDGTIVLESDKAVTTRLGQGLAQRGVFAPEAVERTLQTLRENAAIAHARGATIVAVGTSALREAADAGSFLQAAQEALGVSIEVVSGRREAELTFRGGILGLKLPEQGFTVVDVGGGSTEIVRGKGDKIVAMTSLELGAVRLFEKYALLSLADPKQLAMAEREVEEWLARCPIVFTKPLVAIGGTATTLAAIAGSVEPYQPGRIHGIRLGFTELHRLYESLSRMSLDARRQVRGLPRERADIIVTGAIILIGVVKAAYADGVIVSNGGVRFGLAQETYGNIAIDYGAMDG